MPTQEAVASVCEDLPTEFRDKQGNDCGKYEHGEPGVGMPLCTNKGTPGKGWRESDGPWPPRSTAWPQLYSIERCPSGAC